MASTQTGYVSISGLAFFAASIGLAYYISKVVYNLFLHPLSAFPGPVTYRFSRLPRLWQLVRGNLPFHVAQLHARYGPVVRISPNELAFSDPQAWRDIYGHKQQGQEEFPKFDGFYRPIKGLPKSIMNLPREEHGILRRQLSPGFSERSMRGQEPIIGAYVDLLIQRLRQNAQGGARVLNMREWLNWTTFDIIGDLGFGSAFGCLENSDYHPWVGMITSTIKVGTYIQAVNALGGKAIVTWLAGSKLWKSRAEHRRLVREKVMKRMELGAERPDLIEGLLKKQEDWHMPVGNLASNASVLIIAGSETTATLLSGAVFLLTTNEDKMAKLVQEVRSTFKGDGEITLSSVNGLSYMLACLNESLRRYPPVAIGMPRISPEGGATVAGHFVPGGTTVAVWQWAINHHPAFWTTPKEFHPERFLDDPRFANDRFDAMQPFSVGPRNCIGKNLAYAEMRLILAKIIFNFDVRLADDSKGWLETQKAYILWDKPALNVHLTPVVR